MSKQLTHENSHFIKKQFPIVLLADQVESPANIGSLFRLADAFNIEKIILPENVDLANKRLKRTARATLPVVTKEFYADSSQVINAYQKKGYTAYCLEITNNSFPLDEIKITPNEKILLIVGNENFGVNPQLLKVVNKHIHINMFGKNSSMNIAQATGIALYEITKKLMKIQQK